MKFWTNEEIKILELYYPDNGSSTRFLLPGRSNLGIRRKAEKLGIKFDNYDKFKTPIQDRFWPKVKVGKPNECWEWQGSRDDKGYGRIGKGGRKAGNSPAHRVAWEIENGQIPQKLNVLHKCDNPACCNPKHLFLGDQSDNLIDASNKGRKGKLKPGDIRLIRKLLWLGLSQRELGRKFGVCKSTIGAIKRKENWAHLE